MRAFIHEFKTTNELLFKERNNSLSELRFEVQGLLRVINNTPISNREVKGVTTKGGKTTTYSVQDNDTNIHTKEPLVINHDERVKSNKVLTKDQPQKTNEPVVLTTSEIQTPPIPFPRRLRKEKEEAQQKKFLENLKQLHINLPFIEAIAQMPKYAKFLKGLLTNRARLEEACTITMNERCSAVLLNKLPSKEKDPWSFTIPCDNGQLHINNALADLGASISLKPYTISSAEDDECYGVDKLDDAINIEAQELLANDTSDSFLLKGLEKSIDQSDLESCKSFECKAIDDSNSGEPIRRIKSVNTPYLVAQKIVEPNKVESEQIYSASANEIDEKKPRLKNLPQHLEYAYQV
ncbi:hypothetical protein Tco_0731640 [Tanacetum coccineum]